MDEGVTVEEQIAALKSRHRQLDEEITMLVETASVNALRIQSLKKQKLALKDVIARLESSLLPDIIA
jgi:hypothetical protein